MLFSKFDKVADKIKDLNRQIVAANLHKLPSWRSSKDACSTGWSTKASEHLFRKTRFDGVVIDEADFPRLFSNGGTSMVG